MSAEVPSGVRRVIDVLLALGDDSTGRRGKGVIEVARAVDREKTQISRTLDTLAESGLVDRDPDTKRYRLGWRLFALAASAAQEQLLICAPPIMRGLLETTGERVHLTVLEGGEALTLLSETPNRSVQTASLVSKAIPLHATSCGHALLFDATDAEIRSLLKQAPLVPCGSKAPRTIDDFIARVRRDSAVGYAICVDEFEEGLAAIAAPVRDFRGRIVAALNISGPRFRLHNQLEESGHRVRAAADYLSRNLGWTGFGGSFGGSFDGSESQRRSS